MKVIRACKRSYRPNLSAVFGLYLYIERECITRVWSLHSDHHTWLGWLLSLPTHAFLKRYITYCFFILSICIIEQFDMYFFVHIYVLYNMCCRWRITCDTIFIRQWPANLHLSLRKSIFFLQSIGKKKKLCLVHAKNSAKYPRRFIHVLSVDPINDRVP